MKILIVITKSEIGGAQVFVLNLARSLQKLGYEVVIGAGEGNYLFEELRKNNVPSLFLHSLKRNFSLFNSIYFLYEFYLLLKNKKYDIVHMNSSNALLGAIVAYFIPKRPKLVFTMHGLSLLDKNHKGNYFIKLMTRIYFKVLLGIIDEIVFVSKHNYEQCLEMNIVKSAEVIYNGIDGNELHYFDFATARKFLSTKCNHELSNTFLIGSTGRLVYQKNYEYLINSFSFIKKKIPEAKVVIIGDGLNNDEYCREIKKLGYENDFFFVGEIKDSYQYIKAFDVFALPSRFEGLSISLIEAIYAEIPILTTNVGGNPEVVGNNARQLFNLSEPEDFIIKLIGIRNNKRYYENFNASLKSQFSLHDMVRRYVELYELLNKKG